MTPTLDIDSFEDVQTGVLVIKHPTTGEPTAASITLAGPEHPARQKILMDRTRRLRAMVRKTGKIETTDPLEDLEEETAYLAACTLGWGGISQGGTELPFSPAAAAALYSDKKRQWLRAQVRDALDEVELFINSSASSS